MEDADGIVHHAKGIDNGRKLGVLKLQTHVLGKAGTHQQQSLKRFYPPFGLRHIDYGTKLHA